MFEGVNLNTVNQYSAHTAAGCNINAFPSPDFAVPPSSATLGQTNCGPTPGNSGCYYVDAREGSYGPQRNGRGGSILALQWEQEGIRICGCTVFSTWLHTPSDRPSLRLLAGDFPRDCVPPDLTMGNPQPDRWPKEFLKGSWESTTCPSSTYFKDMSIVFDITLCGDWAGKRSDVKRFDTSS